MQIDVIIDILNLPYYTPRLNEVERGYIGFTLAVCPSVRLWTASCPLCIFNNTRRIHFIFKHLINNYMRCVAYNVCFKTQQFEILANSLNLELWLCLLLTWDPIWLNNMGNRRRGQSSERRRSSCSSYNWFWYDYHISYMFFEGNMWLPDYDDTRKKRIWICYSM